MDANWKSDVDLKKRADAFFVLARNKLCSDTSCIEGLFLKESFKLLDGLIFDYDSEVRRAERELAIRCVKLLESKLGSEKEVANLAWKHVWEDLAGESPTADACLITTRFINALLAHVRQNFRLLTSNHVIRFQGEARRIEIGPVRAVMTRDILAELPKCESVHAPRWKISVGENSAVFSGQPTIIFQLPELTWFVNVHSAQEHVREEAAWLINVALSLLRLSYPADKSYDFFPLLGDLEAMPLDKTKTENDGIITTDKGISGGGFFTPSSYVVDDYIVDIVNSDKFRSRADAIFKPEKGTLAKRFGQGLGWLTRGRQTVDRAERFLFFFTAIEALLSDDDKSAPVVQTIARHAATLLQDEPSKRAVLAKDIRRLYALRSALVHSGERNVSKLEANSVQLVAEGLYTHVMSNVELTSTIEAFREGLSEASYGSHWPLTSAE